MSGANWIVLPSGGAPCQARSFRASQNNNPHKYKLTEQRWNTTLATCFSEGANIVCEMVCHLLELLNLQWVGQFLEELPQMDRATLHEHT